MREPISLLTTAPSGEPLPDSPEQFFLPDAYRLPDGAERQARMDAPPCMVFIEVTNRCNLLCETCPRTYFTREPLKSLTFDEFRTIAEQFPEMRRCALHGIGEPLLNRELPRMIAYLKARGVEVLSNSNGTLLTPAWQEALARSGLDQFRCSIDGALAGNVRTYPRRRLVAQGRGGLDRPGGDESSPGPGHTAGLDLVRGHQENIAELPELVRLAARVGVPEVYLQRMVFFAGDADEQYGMARPDLAIFDSALSRQEAIIAACEALSAELGIACHASGARDLRNSLAAQRPAKSAPWRACMRPWTTAYVTANGNCLPCCISPFSTADYDGLLMGNLFERPFAEIWNDAAYRMFRTRLLSTEPNHACASCGVYWSL